MDEDFQIGMAIGILLGALLAWAGNETGKMLRAWVNRKNGKGK